MPGPAPPLPGSRAGEGEGGRPRAGPCPPPPTPSAGRPRSGARGRPPSPSRRSRRTSARAGEALCHLVLVVLRRGKERWGDGRGTWLRADTRAAQPGARPGPIGRAGAGKEGTLPPEIGALLPTRGRKQDSGAAWLC